MFCTMLLLFTFAWCTSADPFEWLVENLFEPFDDAVDFADDTVSDTGVPDILNPFNDDYLFNPFNMVSNIWEAGEDVCEVVFDSITEFGECIVDNMDDLIDEDACSLPIADDTSFMCGADSDDGFTGWCDLGGLGFTVQFGSLEEGGDQDTASFTAEFGALEHEQDLLKEEWVNSAIKEFTEITATADFLFAGVHSLTIGDGNIFTLSLPAVNLDIDATLSFAAEHAEEPCAEDEDKCTFVLNEGKSTIFRKEFAAGPVPVITELKAEVYLKAIPVISAAANAQFHVYLEEEVPLLNNVDLMLADPEETLEGLVDMFNPIELMEALAENIRFEVTGEVEVSASVQVCMGVIIGFHVNGVGLDVDTPVCLLFEFGASAQGSLDAASASLSASVKLEAIESTLVLSLPDAGSIVDTACAFASLAASPPLDIDISECVPMVGCVNDLADSICDGLSAAASVGLEWELGSFALTEEYVLLEWSAEWSTDVGPMAKKSSTGYCPMGYVPILDKPLCEFYGLEILGLSDTNGAAFDFNHDDADVSRPQGCYHNGGSSLAFNTGIFDAEADDGTRKSICAKQSGIVSPKGFCPTGYKPITTASDCESVAVGSFNLPDSDGEAFVFENEDANKSRPQGCYWNDGSSPNLAFNTGLYDSDANDGQRKIICQPEIPVGPMAKKSSTGYCPMGYVPLLDKALCEYYGVEILGLPDANGEAFEFNHDDADVSRPEGCYWNAGSSTASSGSLAFNTGIFDAAANDGQRQIICAKETGIVSPNGFCPSGYIAITTESDCETIAIEALNLPDSDGQAFSFENEDANKIRPQGCYWNDGSSPNLAFNTGLYDSDASDGQRKIICQPIPEGPMAMQSLTGYCPMGYVPLLDKGLCEYYGLEIIGLSDTNGEAFEFVHDDADVSRPQGCYHNGESSLAFNTGLYDADANDGERRIICAKETAIVSPKGYCPSGYEAIISETECEAIAIEALLLPDSDGQAFSFENEDANKIRPQGCYWNDSSEPNLAFNSGLYDSDANDGQRKIICKPSSGARRLEESASAWKMFRRFMQEQE